MTKLFKNKLMADLLMVLLALTSVLLLIYEVTANLTAEQIKLIHNIDLIIALAFLTDFIVNFNLAKDKPQFFKRRWWELLAAIPITTQTTQVLRSLKFARGLPLIESFRFLRLAIRIKLVLEASKRFTKHAYLIEIAILVCLIIFGSAFVFYRLENQVNPNVKSYWDGVWWAVVTTTTIGYGDIYPITAGGRIVAVVLMLTGIGTLGAFIATFNAYIIKRNR